MGFHTFDADKAERLEEAGQRYRYLSREELLSALDVDATDVVADLGSGTGFYTDDVAPRVETVYAVDIQSAMHDAYRSKGLPENVEPITSGIDEMPIETDRLDAAFSTMTYHEFATPEALSEVTRVVRSGGRVVIADWSAEGDAEGGPPVEERYAPSDAIAALETAEFEIVETDVRPETFLIVARSP